MRKRSSVVILAAALFSASCHKAPKPVDIQAVLPNIPLPPQAQALVSQGGLDAMQFVFVSPVSPDSVVAYYRIALATGPFRLINETATGKSTAFYAEQDGPSIWVTVSPNGNDGSQVVIAGARMKARDSATAVRTP
jgi:hypothetical protein